MSKSGGRNCKWWKVKEEGITHLEEDNGGWKESRDDGVVLAVEAVADGGVGGGG